MVTLHLLLAATLFAIAFLCFTQSTLGKAIMSTQASVDAVVVQLGKAQVEITTRITEVQAQLDAAQVPAESVDLSALVAAAQALDDIVPDVEVLVDEPADVVAEVVVDVPVDVPADEPVDVPVDVDDEAPVS